MMISAMYSEESVDKIIWALDASLDYGVTNEDDFDLIRGFATALSNLKKEGGVVICKPGDYSEMVEALGDE